nr:Chain C, insulin mimotope [Homo sapiens]5UJT_F Chain F, insulin mimotope [Homo sapiens]5UJT_I Chain I, insulin mimotope [Homo sapiens]
GVEELYLVAGEEGCGG